MTTAQEKHVDEPEDPCLEKDEDNWVGHLIFFLRKLLF